jgi:hypothetical protein
MQPRSPCMRHAAIWPRPDRRLPCQRQHGNRQPGFGAFVPQPAPCHDVELFFAARQVGGIAHPDTGRLAEFESRTIPVPAGANRVSRTGHDSRGSGEDRNKRDHQECRNAFHKQIVIQKCRASSPGRRSVRTGLPMSDFEILQRPLRVMNAARRCRSDPEFRPSSGTPCAAPGP